MCASVTRRLRRRTRRGSARAGRTAFMPRVALAPRPPIPDPASGAWLGLDAGCCSTALANGLNSTASATTCTVVSRSRCLWMPTHSPQATTGDGWRVGGGGSVMRLDGTRWLEALGDRRRAAKLLVSPKNAAPTAGTLRSAAGALGWAWPSARAAETGRRPHPACRRPRRWD